MMKADFKSLRGDFRFNTNHYPIQDFYLVKVAKRPDGKVSLVFVNKNQLVVRLKVVIVRAASTLTTDKSPL